VFSGVVNSASATRAALTATFCVGSVTPGTSGAHDSAAVFPRIGSPLMRTLPPSGGAMGERHPGLWM